MENKTIYITALWFYNSDYKNGKLTHLNPDIDIYYDGQGTALSIYTIKYEFGDCMVRLFKKDGYIRHNVDTVTGFDKKGNITVYFATSFEDYPDKKLYDKMVELRDFYEEEIKQSINSRDIFDDIMNIYFH